MNLSDPRELSTLLEAFLLASGKPQSIERLYELFEEAERPEPAVFKKALTMLAKACDGRAVELKEVATGYRLQVREKFAPWVGRLWEERPQRYSRAMLETLALVAYRQPITRGEIEDIRGVAVNSNIVKTLLEREWIRVVGYRDVPGKPAMLATTKQFLDHFNLKSLDQLPPMAELRELEPAPVDYSQDDEAPVPSSLQARADLARADGETAPEAEETQQTSFSSLLAELDSMEQGLKIDFSDLADSVADSRGESEQEVVGEGEQATADAAPSNLAELAEAKGDELSCENQQPAPVHPIQSAPELDEEALAIAEAQAEERAIREAIEAELNERDY